MMVLPRLVIAVLIVALAVMSVGSATAGPNPYIVTRDDDPAPDGCVPNDCSLREAIIDSNAAAPADTIIIPMMDIGLSISGDDSEDSSKGDLDITDSVTIIGENPDNTSVNAHQIDRVFDIPGQNGTQDSDAVVTFRDLSITGGTHGGIDSHGSLHLMNVAVLANTNDGEGGAIASHDGDLIIEDSTIWKNSTEDKGGGIAAHRATTIRNSSIFVNSATGGVGGIWADGGLTLTNVTVHDNTSGAGTGPGGVLIESAPATFINATITDNSASAGVGGIWNSGATVTMSDTIVSGNTLNNNPSNCLGVFGGGHNLVKDQDLGCNLTGDGNITGQGPLLTALEFHGGLTPTRALLKDSPAINNGGDECMAVDQRGILRNDSACDIGAYEYILLGDVDCSGAVALPDISAYLHWLAGGPQPVCFYRGDLQCNLDFGVTDVLFLVRALSDTGFPPPARPDWCGDVGPFEP